MAKLTTIENLTVNYCKQVQKFTDGLDLSYLDIRAISKMLVELYTVRRTLDKLETLNKRHEVIDKRTGKSVGWLYDDERIERVMMSAGIYVDFWIEACEEDIGRQTRKLLVC